MALLAEAGVFQNPSTSITQTVNLSNAIWGGASPAVVLFTGGISTDGNFFGSAFTGFGIGIDSSTRVATAGFANTGQSVSTATNRRHDNTRCIFFLSSVGGTFMEADYVAGGADQFQVFWNTPNPFAANHNFLALGGTDLTNVHLNQIQSPSVTSTVPYNIGVQPDVIFGMSVGESTAPPFTAGGWVQQLGWSDATNEFCITAASQSGVSTSNARRTQGTSNFMEVGWSFAGNTTLETATVNSFTPTGYSLDWTAIATQHYVWILALKGPQVAIFTENQPTSNQTVNTALGFPGIAGLFASFMGAASGGTPFDARQSYSFLDSTGNQNFIGALDEDNLATTKSDRYSDSNEIFKFIDHSPAGVASGTGSFAGNDLSVNWTQTDATARQFGGMVLGSAQAAATVAGAQTLPNATQASTLTAANPLDGAQTLPNISQSASLTAGTGVNVTGAQTLPNLSQAAVATVPVAIAGAQTLPNITQQGRQQEAVDGFICPRFLGGASPGGTFEFQC